MATIQAKTQPRRMPYLVDQINEWIWVHISWEGRHPHWGRELRVLYWSSLVGDLDDAQALHFAWLQATAFRLPLAQLEASGWWEVPHGLRALGCWNFLPQVDSPGTRNFYGTRQEETLALAQALQCYVERLGTIPRVLCEAAQDLQRCMAPLMWLDSDEIIEASLLGPAYNRPITTPTTEEEVVFLGEESELQEGYQISLWASQNPWTGVTIQMVWHSKSTCPSAHSLKLPR